MNLKSVFLSLFTHLFILVSGLGVLILSLFLLPLFETSFVPILKLGHIEGGVLFRTEFYQPIFLIFVDMIIPILGGLMTGWMARNKSWIYSMIIMLLLSPVFFFMLVVSAIDSSPGIWTNPITTYSLWFLFLIIGGTWGEKLYKNHLKKLRF